MAVFDEIFQNQSLTQMESSFQRALAVASKEGKLDGMISYLSTLFDCERIYLFQKNKSGNYDQTYEWCKPGAAHKQHLFQNLHWENCVPYYRRFRDGKMIAFPDIDEIKEGDAELYEILKPQGVRSLLAGQITFQGRDLGFFGIDNIQSDQLKFAFHFMEILRVFMGSLLAGQQQRLHLLDASFGREFTGIGDWRSLHDDLDRMDQNKSIGILSSNLIGLGEVNSRRGRQIGDNLLLETARHFTSVFGEDRAYRIDGDDFIILCEDTSRSRFEQLVSKIKEEFAESGIAIEIGHRWYEGWMGNAEQMLLGAKENRKTVSLYEEADTLITDQLAQIDLYDSDRFFSRAGTWLRSLPEEDRRIIMVAIDFDNFMLYNSIYGREAGNSILTDASVQLLDYSRSFHGLAGYMGGDNFAVLAHAGDLTEDQLAREIQQLLAKYSTRPGFAPSSGVYLCSYQNESPALLYDKALAALTEIKNIYTEHIRFFDEARFEETRDGQLLMLDIEEALEHREFTFYLQPKVEADSGRVTGAEALVRWNRGGRVITPAAFIPRLEQNGFIYALDCYIWEAVCRYQRTLLNQEVEILPISVNISRVDFYFADLAEKFSDLIERYDLDPAYIELEITESAYADEKELISSFVEKARARGFKILIDDFGRGYSSLHMVEMLQADVLKIDRHFMRHFENGGRSQRIISSIVQMARLLNLRVVVEGVETKEQLEALRTMDCEDIQGYLYYDPMSQEEYRTLLMARQGEDSSISIAQGHRVSRMSVQSLFERDLLTDGLINELTGPAAIIEASREHVSLYQMNDAFSALTGIGYVSQEEADRALYAHLENYVSEGEEVPNHFTKADELFRLEGIELHSFILRPREEGKDESRYSCTIQSVGHYGHQNYYFVTIKKL